MRAHNGRTGRSAGKRTPLIAHVIFRLDTGGMENGLVNLINHMPAGRYRHAILCLTDYTDFRERLESSDVPVIALHKRDGKDFGAYVRLWKVLRDLRPDFVHTRNLGTVDGVFAAVLAGVRFRIHGEHGWDMMDIDGTRRRYRWLRRLCSLFTHRHITVSEHLADWLREVVHIPSGKITRIYNGVDTGRFFPGRAGRPILAERGIAGPDSIVIGSVGRMAAVKNPVMLAQAFASLLSRNGGLRDRLCLVMIGDGPLRNEVRETVEAAGIADRVWLPGERDDVAGLLREFDIFVIPSLNEGISNTILEAMASGVPVVATDVGGNPELVMPGVSGVLVEAGNPDALAEGIQGYLDRPELRKEHGAEGRRMSENRFSLESMVNRYLAVYDELAGLPDTAGRR